MCNASKAPEDVETQIIQEDYAVYMSFPFNSLSMPKLKLI